MSIFSLEGQTAMITGCTRGIGQAVAIGLAEAGADVILIQVSRLVRLRHATSYRSPNLIQDKQLTPFLP